MDKKFIVFDSSTDLKGRVFKCAETEIEKYVESMKTDKLDDWIFFELDKDEFATFYGCEVMINNKLNIGIIKSEDYSSWVENRKKKNGIPSEKEELEEEEKELEEEKRSLEKSLTEHLNLKKRILRIRKGERYIFIFGFTCATLFFLVIISAMLIKMSFHQKGVTKDEFMKFKALVGSLNLPQINKLHNSVNMLDDKLYLNGLEIKNIKQIVLAKFDHIKKHYPDEQCSAEDEACKCDSHFHN